VREPKESKEFKELKELQVRVLKDYRAFKELSESTLYLVLLPVLLLQEMHGSTQKMAVHLSITELLGLSRMIT
jgi:hypothetical protein